MQPLHRAGHLGSLPRDSMSVRTDQAQDSAGRGGYVRGVDEEAITIKLTRDQAFVLSDWLHQVMFRSDDLEGIVYDRAVWSPIHTISGSLDKSLSEIFMHDYGPRLEAAKDRLRTHLYGEDDQGNNGESW
ncbi:putative protein OS=Streptomyces griseorubiginosus OX=67304 GN=DWG14_04608 PE=4 SV=1 [Streptomyces griseorubiginosus]